MMEEAKAKQKEHLPSFCVITHDIMSARRVADYINVLWKGRIVEAGPSEDMLSTPRTRSSASSSPANRRARSHGLAIRAALNVDRRSRCWLWLELFPAAQRKEVRVALQTRPVALGDVRPP
jgi:ABC-type dipeptide/oligopeptide/nickel transport system ATPase component